ncbi:hypothetical protein MKX03_002003 [Papaver bracteatum]|nr:hypothetical protein MKX03_002003 [Papaver bracteatum]
MGQKINPLGFRLGTTQKHHSLWFEDQKIWDCIKNYVQKNMRISSGTEGIVRIEIKKRTDLVQVIIYMGFPEYVQKGFDSVNRKLNIAITRIAKPNGDPNILAEFIVGQLKNRVSFRNAMKKAIELTEQADTTGTQVQIAGHIDKKEITRVEWIREGRVPLQIVGHIDKKEIARVEWIREGRVPLQTIRAKIDYCSCTFQTIYGVLDIKIWIFTRDLSKSLLFREHIFLSKKIKQNGWILIPKRTISPLFNQIFFILIFVLL